jgi:ribosome-associated protein
MDIRKLQRVIVDGLEDVKAQNIVVFNTEHLSSLFERVIIASGTSNRQTKSLASSVREAVKRNGAPVPRTEGEANGEWIIVDCGAAVVHVMQPTIRDYYHLEEIWGGKPVNMKLASVGTGLVKAAPLARAAAKRVAPLAPAPRAAKSAKAHGASGPAGVSAASRGPGAARAARKKAAPGKGGVAAGRGGTRVVGVKTAAKTVPKPAPAKPVVTVTVGAQRPAAKKAPAKPLAGQKTTSRAGAPKSAAPRSRSAAKPTAPRKAPTRA